MPEAVGASFEFVRFDPPEKFVVCGEPTLEIRECTTLVCVKLTQDTFTR